MLKKYYYLKDELLSYLETLQYNQKVRDVNYLALHKKL